MLQEILRFYSGHVLTNFFTFFIHFRVYI